MTRGFDIYGGRDPVELPAYSIAEAARLIRVPQATVRSWVLGRRYPTVEDRRKLFAPVILIADSTGRSLSFRNLVELHVLSAIRRDHGVRLGEVRKAVDYLRRRFKSSHPLADEEMQTDGKNLFVERYGELVDASAQGQMAMKECLRVYLDRIERDARRGDSTVSVHHQARGIGETVRRRRSSGAVRTPLSRRDRHAHRRDR